MTRSSGLLCGRRACCGSSAVESSILAKLALPICHLHQRCSHHLIADPQGEDLEVVVVGSLNLPFCCSLPELQHDQERRQAASKGVDLEAVVVERLHLLLCCSLPELHHDQGRRLAAFLLATLPNYPPKPLPPYACEDGGEQQIHHYGPPENPLSDPL